jgi:hypothetical protein
METNFNGQSNPDELEAGQDDNQIHGNAGEIDAHALENQDQKKRVKHEDHNVSRKYRLFSNHSSYGDSPHTNTSI